MEGFDPRTRELCPDDACIGLIGPDGRCKECGTVSPNEVSDRRNRGLKVDEDGDAESWSDDERELCSDDACIGLIGPDGRCKECGLQGKRPAKVFKKPASADPPKTTSKPGGGKDKDPNDWDDRELCTDGGCIGIIGTDGRCRECGKPAGFEEE